MNINTKEEIWKDIKEFDGFYKISNMGRVWTKRSNRLMKRYVSSNGYEHVSLRTADGRNVFRQTHRLVADAFIPNPKCYPTVNHIDENKTNNVADNLEWCTYQDNALHGTRIDRVSKAINYDLVAKKNSKAIGQYSLDGKLIRRWGSAKDCKRETGYDNSNIIKCCKGKAKTAYGFIWKYEKE